MANKISGAHLLVQCLAEQGIEYVFGIPGAKIDAVFNVLKDYKKPRLIVCRHEQNAAFMAACIGKLTGTPGVALVTSGPGVANLATGLLTATTEGDPMIAIGGAVPRFMKLKRTHQSMDNVAFTAHVTKQSVEIEVPESIPEIVANSFRIANEPRRGAVFISLPQDVGIGMVDEPSRIPDSICSLGAAPQDIVIKAVNYIEESSHPVLLLGMGASDQEIVAAIHRLLRHHPLATIETFQAAGALSEELAKYFAGRVGIWNNQPGDRLLSAADLVITVGFNPVEYDPEQWNVDGQLKIIHIGNDRMMIGYKYHPIMELRGDIAATLDALTGALSPKKDLVDPHIVERFRSEMNAGFDELRHKSESLIHPLRFIRDLQKVIDNDTTVISDVGSHYMWLARHLYCYRPKHLLFSNGQQTLGVALPWAIAATLARPQEKVISISGDGGFLFSAMELETAVREKCRFVHFVWRDGSYNMVRVQEIKKYGRPSGVDFGRIDLVKFAQGFGAKGLTINTAEDIVPALKEAQAATGPVLIEVPIDYSDNDTLFENASVNAGD